MGLVAQEVEIIADLVKDLPRPFNVLSLGHPDILASPEELSELFDRRLATDNEEVRASRKYQFGPEIIGNAEIVFGELGAALHVVDARQCYGVDEIVDLNEPLPDRFRQAYDLVVDPGTTEHCFNVAQALKNVAESVKVGGLIYHMVPMVNMNHGFWNFSPCAFSQFYSEDNGYRIVQMRARNRNRWVDVPPQAKFKISNDGIKLGLMCIAKRMRMAEIRFPTLQAKYA